MNYGIVQLPYLEYNNPPKIYFQSELFDGVLENNVLIITLKIQVEKEEDAIELVKPFIRAWEIHASLTRGADELKFIFNGSTSKEIDSDSVSSGILKYTAQLHVTFSTVCLAQRTAYPEPPLDFKYSPNLDSLCYRYENYLKHKETITGMGYFCLSLLEWESGGRKKTSLKYSIEYGLLKKLGELTSTKGDLREARKLELKKDAKPVALSDAERTWIVEVVRRIILRKGEYDFDPKAKLKTITLEDFLKI